MADDNDETPVAVLEALGDRLENLVASGRPQLTSVFREIVEITVFVRDETLRDLGDDVQDAAAGMARRMARVINKLLDEIQGPSLN